MGRLCAIAFMVWCDLWQWMIQSPGASATNSMSRVAPTGTFTVVSGTCAESGVGPPSVPVVANR